MTEIDFENAVYRNSQRLFLIALSYTKNQYDAEDIMQNTLLKLWSYSDDFCDNTHIDKWLTKVCINECKDIFRRLFKVKAVPLESAYDIAIKDEHFNIDLFNAVSSLPKKERVVVHLFYYEDMTISEISEILNINDSTIKSILFRARKRLKNKLGDEWINE